MIARVPASPRSLVMLVLVVAAASGCIADPPTAPNPPCLEPGASATPACSRIGRPDGPIKT